MRGTHYLLFFDCVFISLLQKDFRDWMLSNFTSEQVFNNLALMESSATTKQNHLRTITSLFNKALQLGVVSFYAVV